MDTGVLITHCPPHGVLDSVRPRITAWGPVEEESEPLGCEELAIRLASVKPRLHVFGHIHDGYGILQRDGTTYVNASVCNEDYEAIHPVLVVDLEPNGSPKVIGTASGKLQQRSATGKPCTE